MHEIRITPEKDVPLEIGTHEVQTGKIFYGFIPGPHRSTDPIEILRDVREAVGDLHPSKTTFKLRQLETDADVGEITAVMVALCGCWIYEHRGDDMSSATVYAHHDRDDAWLYSRVFPECECGATVVTARNNGENELEKLPGRTDHADGCCHIWRQRARLELTENRRRALQQWFRLGHYITEAGPRIGMSYDHVRDLTDRLDVDIDACRDEYREMVAHTAAAHLHKHSPQTIAEAFGFEARSSLQTIIDEHLDVDYFEMRGLRMRNDPVEIGNIYNAPQTNA